MDERDARALFTAAFKPRRNVAGLADDAAVFPVKGRVVVTTDSFRDGTHFPPGARPEDAAYLATAGTLSDLAGMGADPVGVLVALGLPPRAGPKLVHGLARGVKECLDLHGGELLGGDTKPAPTLELVTTGIGTLAPGRGLFRTGARPGDAVCVTGRLGGAGAALEQVLDGTLPARHATSLLRPTPRVRAGAALARLGVRAGLDLSDGLAAGARDLAAASGVRVEIAASAVPLHDGAAAAGRARGLQLALAAGGDYELLVAVAPTRLERAVRAAGQAGAPLSVVGRVTKGTGTALIGPDGAPLRLPNGFVHALAPRKLKR